MADIVYEWRGPFVDDELNELHAAAFEHGSIHDDWGARLDRHSVGWVTARDAGRLVGFVNLVWDGGVHAFMQDTIVDPNHQRRGIGKRMVEISVEGSREAGCEWLHVDFEEHLAGFYFDAAGFEPTAAGLIALR